MNDSYYELPQMDKEYIHELSDLTSDQVRRVVRVLEHSYRNAVSVVVREGNNAKSREVIGAVDVFMARHRAVIAEMRGLHQPMAQIGRNEREEIEKAIKEFEGA